MKKSVLFSLLFSLLCAFQANAQIANAHVMIPTSGGAPMFGTNHFEAALTTLGVSTTTYLEDQEAAYFAAIAAANPATDLFIIDNWNQTVSWDASGIVAFINNGGRVIFSSWRLNTNPNTRAALGVLSASNNSAGTYSIYDWGGSNIFNGTPNPMTFTDPIGFGTNTTRFIMQAAGAATVAGFVAGAGTPNEGAIIINNGGNTIAFGACMNLADNPADGAAMALGLINATSGMTPTVPTMGEWGLIILALFVLSFGTVFMMRRQTAIAGAGNVSMSQSSGIPFDRASFGKMLAVTMIGLVAVFAVAVFAFGYEMTSADVPGALIAGPIGAYLLHLLFGTKK